MGNSCNSTIFQTISPMSNFSNMKCVLLRLAECRLLQMHATCVAETLPLQCSACSRVVHICSERRPLVYSLCAAMSDHVRTVDTTCQTQLALCFLFCHAIFHNLGCIVVALLPEVFLYSHTSLCIFVICVLTFFFDGMHC